MIINIEWQDENGKQLARYCGPSITSSLFQHAADNTACLRFIDPYGDTIFNQHQVQVLECELTELLRIDGEVSAQATKLLEFVRSVPDRTHRYLKFIGD